MDHNKKMPDTGLLDPALLRSQCYLHGEWIGEPSHPVCDPANGRELGRVPWLGSDAAAAAVSAAEAAFRTWSRLIARERARLLRRWFDLIQQHRDDLARLLTLEQGKPLSEALAEIDYAAAFVEFFAEESKRIRGETIPSHRPDARITVLRQPIGVCAAITPWNFPAAMITRKCAPALAAGCTVVLKPAPETPLTALALAALAERAGFPPGILNVVTGDAAEIGQQWCSDERVRGLSFTGSTAVGRTLMRQSAETVKRLSLELGGNAPLIVFDDADRAAAVDGALAAKFRNMGQTCICANRIYVQAGLYDDFVAGITAKVQSLRLGHGLEPGVQQGPLIHARAVQKVEQHVADAIARGARLHCGGSRSPLGSGFYQPTVLDSVPPDALICREETFGPIAAVVRFTEADEVLNWANSAPYGLAAYFYTTSPSRIWQIAEGLESGMVGVNTTALSFEAAPFGGVKQSGFGREGSHHGLEEFLHHKYVLQGALDNAP